MFCSVFTAVHFGLCLVCFVVLHSVLPNCASSVWCWKVAYNFFCAVCPATALGVQQPSLLGASPSMYSQQSALAAASLNTQSAANYQISQQTAALQQQAAAAAAAALQQVIWCNVTQYSAVFIC